jgi:tRNA pseudouridine55 synthase
VARRRRRPFGRRLDGILVLNKGIGDSSNDALQRAKRILFAAKAGHTGSLDPKATGVLPICFGEGTKFTQFLLDADKEYNASIKFGVRTDTGDVEGEERDHTPAPELTEADVVEVLKRFEGKQTQVPSMYSALKHNGVPLYKLAREGKTVEREARDINLFHIELKSFTAGEYPEAVINVHCSKGTYIRTLVEDIGEAIGCGAHVTALHRIQAGPFHEDDAHTLDQLSELRGENRAEVLDHLLIPIEAAVDHLPKVVLNEAAAYYLRQGQPVQDNAILRIADAGDWVRIADESGNFMGIGEVNEDGLLAPRRLVAE